MEELGRQEDLVRVLEQLLKADPASVKMRLKLADVHARAKHYDEALKLLAEIPRTEKVAADRLYEISAGRFNDGDTDGAITTAKLGLEFNRDEYRLLRVLGRSYAAKGDAAQAIENLDRAVSHAPAGDPESKNDHDLVESLKKPHP